MSFAYGELKTHFTTTINRSYSHSFEPVNSLNSRSKQYHKNDKFIARNFQTPTKLVFFSNQHTPSYFFSPWASFSLISLFVKQIAQAKKREKEEEKMINGHKFSQNFKCWLNIATIRVFVWWRACVEALCCRFLLSKLQSRVNQFFFLLLGRCRRITHTLLRAVSISVKRVSTQLIRSFDVMYTY